MWLALFKAQAKLVCWRQSRDYDSEHIHQEPIWKRVPTMQVWQKKKVCYVSAEDVTENKYNHNEWEESSTKIMIALHHLQLCLLEKLVTNKSNRGQKVVYSFTKMPLEVHGLFLTQSSKKTERTSISEADWKSPVSHSASPKLDPAVLKLCVLQNPTREEFSEMQLPPVTTLI